MTAVALIGVVGLVVLLRLLPAVLWRTAESDSGYHMLVRREIRRNRMRVPERIAALALDERQTYPWLYHWLLALLPERLLERWQVLPSIAIDALHAALAFALGAWLGPRVDPGLDPALTGFLAGALFASSPALLAVGIGPRAYDITPRPMGELLYSAALVAAGWSAIEGSLWAGLAAVLATTLLLLSSKFSVQVIASCLPPLALVTGQWAALAALPLGLAAALLLFGRRYWWILGGHIAHLQLYRERLQYDHQYFALVNQFRKTFATAADVLRSGFRDRKLLGELFRLLESNTYIQMLIRNVLWVGVLVATAGGLFQPWPEAARSWQAWLLAWSVTPLLPFLISSLPNWQFLGEAERYLEYAVLPVCVLGAIGLQQLAPGAGAALLAAYSLSTLLILAYFWLRRRWNSRRNRRGTLDEALAFLRTLAPGTVILALPMSLAFSIAYRLEHRFLAAIDSFVWHRSYDQIFIKYPWPVADLGWWRREHSAQYLLVMRKSLARLADPGVYQLEGLRAVFVNDEYAVYDLTSPRARAEGLVDRQEVGLPA